MMIPPGVPLRPYRSIPAIAAPISNSAAPVINEWVRLTGRLPLVRPIVAVTSRRISRNAHLRNAHSGFQNNWRLFMTQIAPGIVRIIMASAIYLFVEKFVDRH